MALIAEEAVHTLACISAKQRHVVNVTVTCMQTSSSSTDIVILPRRIGDCRCYHHVYSQYVNMS